jgi:hypothetical protein
MKQKLLVAVMLFNMFSLYAQTSKVNVTIDGPGVVDEYYLLGADGSKQLKLKAVPSKFLGDVTFDGWSGDATGTATELTIAADKVQNIHAKFTYHRPVKKYPLVNLKQSWTDMGSPIFFEMPTLWETQDLSAWRGSSYLPVDYNRDGYMDYVQFPKKGGMGTDNHRENVRFWLGKPDGSFEEDPLNDNRMLGTVYSIHVKYADFNDDGYPDFCSFSTGYDRTGSTGDYPVVLMSDANCVYRDLRYPAYQEPNNNSMYGTFHGGTTGDFDNDGDIDIIFWNNNDSYGHTSLYLENDGKGNFTERKASEILDLEQYIEENSDGQNLPWFLDAEFIDINNDGYNDLAFTGIDRYKDESCSSFFPTPVVFWGSSNGKYGGSNYSVIPPPRLGYAINESFAFYDFNGDGVKEIIVLRNADGENGTSFYKGGYLQVCELINGEFVDKTSQYVPVEHKALNKDIGDVRMCVENIDGIDYLLVSQIETILSSGLGAGVIKPYALRNGVMESLEEPLKTKISSFDEGIPLYADGPWLADLRYHNDGVNPVDTMAEHSWADASDWDATTGNMWRIDFAHRKDTHFGRTCIRWNRDGQDPKKELEMQGIEFTFFSEVDLQSLAKEGYYLEFYIKNTDPDLTLNVGLETYDDNTPESLRGYYATISSKHVEGNKFTGEWQRVLYPLAGMNGNEGLKIRTIVMRVDKGDLSNEFYLDDIRIRRLADSGLDDYDRAFLMDYLPSSYYQKERTAQVGSQEFKAMLKPLISKFAPDSMNYFNKYITDYEVPLTRGMAACMAYYTARSIGAETNNAAVGEQPEDIWDGDINNYDDLLPHWQDPGEKDAPADMFWRGTVFGGRMTCWYWNFWHVSDKSGINVIGLDKEANSFHWNNPLTWEDAIRAITRLYDSLDPELVASMQEDPVTITAKSYEIIYGEDLPTFEYTSEGTELDGTPSITCEATKNSPVGTYPIVITKGSVKNYNDTYVNGTLTIKKAQLIVIPKDYNIKQGDNLPAFEVTYEGFRNNETSAVLTKQPTTTTTATSTNEPGVYEINASGAEAQNYDISYSKGKLTIEAVEITPITETEEISFREQITADADLENVVIDNIYYNVKSANGDGYNATEQALVLNSTTSSTQMSAVQGAQVGDAAVRENFSGIIFEIPAGQGVITVDAKTIGTHVLNVQIGNGAPTQVKKTERGTAEVEYNVSAPTYVYLYASTESGASARLYRGPSAGVNSVLLYGYKVQVGGTGIEELKNGKMEELKYYDLNGRKVKTPRKGVYIINGKKVVVK